MNMYSEWFGKIVPITANIPVEPGTERGMDYLLTWNCRHIDNAETKPVIRSVCAKLGYACPEICTPEELMGDQDER
jgi:hypothetical protein